LIRIFMAKTHDTQKDRDSRRSFKYHRLVMLCKVTVDWN
jgi:hypothetical protein